MTEQLHASEIARNTAEAAMFDAQREFFAAQARKWDADAKIADIKVREQEDAERRSLALDIHHHVYRFADSVSQRSVVDCLEQLAEWDRIDPNCDMTIVFNSPGGHVIDGMALYDTLVAYSKRGGGHHHVTTTVRGYAASMAGILLQAGDERVIGPESYLMIHEISAGTGGKIGEIKDDVKFYDRICARVVDIFVARAGGKCTKQRFIKSWTRTDWWLDSEQAVKLGFADRVG